MVENSRIEDLKRRVQSDPASIAFAALAEEYRRAGQYENAISTCKAGLQRHPAYLSARVTLGRALLEVQRFDEAREELEYVLKVAPENLAAIRGLAEIHHRRGELPAEEHYKAVLDAAQRETHAADYHAPHTAAPRQTKPREGQAPPAPLQPAPRQPVGVSAVTPRTPAGAVVSPAPPRIPVAAAAGGSAASAPTSAAQPVIQPVRAQQSAATPAPVPAADPALAGLEAYLSAILRAREDLERTSLRR